MVIALCHHGLVRIDMLPNIVRFLAHILFLQSRSIHLRHRRKREPTPCYCTADVAPRTVSTARLLVFLRIDVIFFP